MNTHDRRSAGGQVMDSVAVLRDILAAYECQAESHEGEPAGEQAEIWADALRRAIASLQAAPGAAAVGDALVDSVRADIMQNAANEGQTHIVIKDEWVRAALEAALATPSAPVGVEGIIAAARLIVDGAMPATNSGHTCFVPRYQIDKLKAALAATPAVSVGDA